MVKSRIWETQNESVAEVKRLSEELRVPRLIAHLLAVRGLTDPETAYRFLHPSLDHLHDPWQMADMARAVERLSAAIARKEQIVVHGDYDVDGITSTVILKRALELLGANVVHFIPERLQDGYGLQADTIDRLVARGARVVVSVDCGIRSVQAAERASALGLDLIVTDHHEPDGQLPKALAVINPKRSDCSYPDKHLAGVGVAFKLVHALCATHDRLRWLPGFIKLAAIGTLADVVPLVGENRVIAKLGLERLSAGPNTVGLRALIEGAGLSGRTLDSYHVTFMLAPRVNAAGRMSSPDIATRLLLVSEESQAAEARQLAHQLNEENVRRQQEEAQLLTEARKVIEKDPAVGAHNVLVVGGLGWHRGVIGIVAAKLVDTYYKPAIVLSFEGDIAHGSCRSIPAFDMLGALEGCADVFHRFGGHKQAAGLTMDVARVGEFRARINELADDRLDPEQLIPRLRVDGSLPLERIDSDMIQALDQLAPHGAANPRPLFTASGVEVVSGPRPLKERHLAMTLKQGRRVMRAIAWRAAPRAEFVAEHKGCIDVAYSLERSEYRGETSIELNVADFRPGSS